jgi:flagellar hook-basal body complex protein FliE
MSIEALASINAGSMAASHGVAGAAPQSGTAFSEVLEQISALNTQFAVNDRAIRSIALGDSVNLHEVMMDLERTRITFDLMLQVRNKLLDAYQELMRLQV